MKQRTPSIAVAAVLALLALLFGTAAIAGTPDGPPKTPAAPGSTDGSAGPDCPGHPGGMGGPGTMSGPMGHGPGGMGGPGGGHPHQMMEGPMGRSCCEGGPGGGPPPMHGGRMGHCGHGPDGMAGPGGQHSDAVLKEAFGLSDAQVAGLKVLGEKRQASVEALHKQMADGRKALEETLKAEKPEPAKVGNALLAVRGYEKQMPKIEETYRAGFKALLTPDQQKKLAELEAVRAAQALRQLGM